MDNEQIKLAARDEESFRMVVLAMLSDIDKTLDSIEAAAQTNAAATAVYLQLRTEMSTEKLASEIKWMKDQLF